MIPAEKITKAISPFGLNLNEEQLQKFDTYGEFLVEYNNKVNLTAITAPDEIAVKHFADSIIPLALTEINEGASLIDVGTGAGFPGVALKVARPDIELTLLDSLNKRLVFLGELSEKLGQQNKLVHSRAENAGVDPELREKYDVATSRAVAQLAALCEYCLPLVKVGGKMIALKGGDCAAEIAAAENAIKLLGGKLKKAEEYFLADAGKRTLVVIDKVAPTPKKYPRQRVKITEKPL